MIHVANTVAEFIKELKTKGNFNGVRFVELYNTTQTEPYEGEETQEEFEKRIEGHASFVAHADLYGDDFQDEDTEYNERTVDWGKYETDFENELRKRLGDDVTIEYRSGCNEYECIRVEGYSHKKAQETEAEKRVLKVDGYPVKKIVAACKNLSDLNSAEVIEMASLMDVQLAMVKEPLKELAIKVLAKYGQLI